MWGSYKNTSLCLSDGGAKELGKLSAFPIHSL